MTDWAAEAIDGGSPLLEPSGPAETDSGPAPGLLLLAAGGAALAGALALLGGVALNLLGYVASSLLVFTLVALFRRRSVRRSALLGTSVPRNLNLAAFCLLGIGFVLSIVHAWLIASHFS